MRCCDYSVSQTMLIDLSAVGQGFAYELMKQWGGFIFYAGRKFLANPSFNF